MADAGEDKMDVTHEKRLKINTTKIEFKIKTKHLEGCDVKNEENSEAKVVDKTKEENEKVEHSDEKEEKVEKFGDDDKKEENSVESKTAVGDKPEPPGEHEYEVVDGQYCYTDAASGQRYQYHHDKGAWLPVEAAEEKAAGEVTTDSEGRTFYYADNMHLCRDADGNVFYWEAEEWKPWADRQKDSRWYFYRGEDTFYRDHVHNKVYRLNKDTNQWEEHQGKLRAKKRPRLDEEEEFDTESEDEEDEDEDEGDGSAPPGVRNDPSIEYDGVTYTKRDPGDNTVYEWDVARRAWFPKLDEDFMATYQLSYGFNPDGTKNLNPLKFDDDEEEREAARLAEEEERKREQEEKKKEKKKPTWFEMDDTRSTKVYVSNLAEDTTEEEFVDMMQKCGMVLKDVHTNKFKVKLYKDAEGNFKGDALCTYIKVESVELALQILDDADVGGRRIHVERAKFTQKGEYNPKLKPQKRKKKELEKMAKQQEKLFDWRPEPMRGQRQKHENTVVIRNAFDPKEFEQHMEKILTHKEAIRNQCLNFGAIKKLELFDLHPDGVVQVTFKEVEGADLCVATLNKRLYESRTLDVATWDGKTKFKVEETDAEREARLAKWSKMLEDQETTET